MPTTDELRTQLAVAELEERLVALKDGGDPEELAAIKEDLRYVRWVARGGPAIEEAALAEHHRLAVQRQQLATQYPEIVEQLPPLGAPHTNRHVADLYARWKAEQA